MMHDAVASFWSSSYAPHGYCLLWRPDLILTHLISDILIALAYFSIPFALIRFVRKRPEIEFGGVFWLFAIFIMACGMTHVLSAWNLWHGDYGLEGVVKLITAAASVPTAIVLWKILPRALLIPSPNDLQTANDRLSAMVMERDLALGRLELEVRERLKTEEALVQVKKIDAIGQLTGGIAHDFNNLLQAISGNVELIARNLDKRESIIRWAANAGKAVERGAKLAKQLLVFARVQQLEKTLLDANEVVSNVVELVERSVGGGIEVLVTLADEPCPVVTEAHQLELAIVNLCINARDAMPEGGRLTISTSHVDPGEAPASLPPGSYVRIAVADMGTGMTPEVASKALDPFFTTKDVGKGTGLGLSMAFGFARQSDGVLQLTTEPGRGTTVEIFLPRVAPAAEQSAKAPKVGSARPGLLSPTAQAGRILVVDDDEDVRNIIGDMLTDRGYDVRQFAHAAEFLAADDLDANLIVVDFMMPEMNGADLAIEIRRRKPRQKVLIVSGYSDSEALANLADPITRVLRKPFNADDLDAAIAGF